MLLKIWGNTGEQSMGSDCPGHQASFDYCTMFRGLHKKCKPFKQCRNNDVDKSRSSPDWPHLRGIAFVFANLSLIIFVLRSV